MSILSIEYAVHRVRASNGEILSKHGPYYTLADAEQQRREDERVTEEHPARRNLKRWITMERSVTEWEPVPTVCPDWPEED